MKLSSKIKTALMALALVVAGAGAVVVPSGYAFADGESWRSGMEAANPGTTTNDLPTIVKNIINGVLYVVGVLAVVMVIIGGVKYTTSGGDQAAVTSAKNTILYGIIGLVISVLAYAIVNFVIGKVVA